MQFSAEAQSFDGPAPETINGRLAMLGVTSALAAEFVTGVGLREQWLKAPAPILFSFAIIAIASYIPILKGFTRYRHSNCGSAMPACCGTAAAILLQCCYVVQLSACLMYTYVYTCMVCMYTCMVYVPKFVCCAVQKGAFCKRILEHQS